MLAFLLCCLTMVSRSKQVGYKGVFITRTYLYDALPFLLTCVNGSSLLNPLIRNGHSHPYQLGESTFIYRGIRTKIAFLFHFSVKIK